MRGWGASSCRVAAAFGYTLPNLLRLMTGQRQTLKIFARCPVTNTSKKWVWKNSVSIKGR